MQPQLISLLQSVQLAESQSSGGIKQLRLPLRLDVKHSRVSNVETKPSIFLLCLARSIPRSQSGIKRSRQISRNLSWDFFFQINLKTTPKVIFQKVAILFGKNHKSAPIILKTENTIIPPTEIPEALSRYFYNTSTTLNFPSHFLNHKTISEARPLPSIDASDQNYNSLFSLDERNWALHKCRGISSGPDNIAE